MPSEEEYEPLTGTRTSLLQKNRKLIATVGLTLLLLLLLLGGFAAVASRNHHKPSTQEAKCDRVVAVGPSSHQQSIAMILNDPLFKKESVSRFTGALKIPTEINDWNPQPSDDPGYYQEFFNLHGYLNATFPLVHSQLLVEKINGLGLLYTWEGRNTSLKPLMLASHQDVVPVNPDTVSQWRFPPYAGHYDESTDEVYGRGAVDCKNLLVAELEAVEQLLKDGFKPQRSVLIAVGFDEEASGMLGARSIAEFLQNRYGNDSIYAIVDEGSAVVALEENLYIATPITAEKGFVNIEYSVHGHGGHSSVPPDHTTIGIAAELINLMEQNPFGYSFTPENPLYDFLVCYAKHSSTLPRDVKSAILEAPFDTKQKAKLVEYVSKDHLVRELLRTSQAVDIIRGGVKSNALPEVTSFLVNHRVDINSSVRETVEKDLEHVKEVAAAFGLGVTLDGMTIVPPSDEGYIEVVTQLPLEPAPQSPTSDSPVWDLFAGTIQDVFENHFFKDQKDVEFYVAPALVSGNTDTRYYWSLTENIYRFVGMLMPADTFKTIHSVNEHIKMSSHLTTIAFVYEYIVNVNERA